MKLRRGHRMKIVLASAWTALVLWTGGAFEHGLSAIDEGELMWMLTGLVVIFALDFWGSVKGSDD